MENLFFKSYQKNLNALCQRYQVQALYAFGSVLTEKFSEKSDLDFLVLMPDSLEALEKGENLLGLWLALEQLFDRKIDLLTHTSVKNPYLQAEIVTNKQLLYGQQNEKIFAQFESRNH